MQQGTEQPWLGSLGGHHPHSTRGMAKIGHHLPVCWGEATEKSPPRLVMHRANPKASSLCSGMLMPPPMVGFFWKMSRLQGPF